MKNRLLIALFLINCNAAIAGNDHVPVGARAAALSNAVVCVSDVWSLHNNVAGIAHPENNELGAFAENRFRDEGFYFGCAFGRDADG